MITKTLLVASLLTAGYAGSSLLVQQPQDPDGARLEKLEKRVVDTQASLKMALEEVSALKGSIDQMAIAGVPAGTIVAFAGGGKVPDGWALCDGTEISPEAAATTFKRLADAIGSSWDDPEHKVVRLPRLEGQFLRGADNKNPVGKRENASTGAPNNPNFGIKLSGAHSHNFEVFLGSFPDTGAPAALYKGTKGEDRSTTSEKHKHDKDDFVNWDSETRPANCRVQWIIKL
jgi:hypothetical protein